ncbi:hypothetical protein NW762_008107 [Fusarium torreyae]|uniref:Uncharacterized protein n=1 Tax=Fusarium torreyae TaxID=1237075 RepID=A0A9W8RYW1_9HYPO|nr:hypothetical protein NW762_008107 [Fusarium torreyae]
MSAKNTTNNAATGLPANVQIFAPKNALAVNALLAGRIFTRLVASASTKQTQLATAIKQFSRTDESFCLIHRNAVLIFDGGLDDKQGDQLEDVHHEHFRQVCLALKEYDIGLDVAGCIHDATDSLGAGFQLDKLSDKSALVIDLVEEEEDSDDEG